MEQAPIAAGPLEATVRDLPPQHLGQARTMLICETENTVRAEVGHWYSPEKVAELLAEEREACAKVMESEPFNSKVAADAIRMRSNV